MMSSHSTPPATYSFTIGFDGSKVRDGLRDMTIGDSNIMESSSSSSSRISPGVGEVISIDVQQAPFWGRGEMSIKSLTGTGDEVAGRGGVVMYSSRLVSKLRLGLCRYCLPRPPMDAMRFEDWNRARRGVGKCGLSTTCQLLAILWRLAHTPATYLASLSILKFCERSAARLAVGDEPRTDFRLK